MKKHLLSMLFASVAATAMAQPTLITATNNPVIGDSFYGYMTDSSHVDIGSAGASVTWDMSAIVKNDSDTTTYMACSATPNCSLFPGSNIVMYNAGDYAYGISGTSGIEMIGAYAMGTDMHMTNNMTYTKFPLSMSTSFNDTFETTVSILGMTLYITSNSTNTVDAFGTLMLPTGTFNNVLRVHSVVVEKDSSNILGTPDVSLSQTETYSWYVTGFHSPLLTVNLDTAGASSPYVTDAKYYAPATSLSVANTALQNGMNVYPNPASNDVHITLGAAGTERTLYVADMTGKAVYTQIVKANNNGGSDVVVPVSNLANGLYVVRVIGDGSVTTAKFSVIK